MFSYVLSNSTEVFTIFGPDKKITHSVKGIEVAQLCQSELQMCCCQTNICLLDLSANRVMAAATYTSKKPHVDDTHVLEHGVAWYKCGTLVQICSYQQTSCTCRFVAPESCCLHSILTYQET